MDVTLSSSAVIPYLDKCSIEEYANLNFYSEKGELVKMNLVVLAALRSSLANSLTDADFEDCCVLTEFSKSELDEVNEFIWTGKCQLSLAANVFAALGIDVHSLSEPFPLHIAAPKVKLDTEETVKYEVKEEDLSDGDGDDWAGHLDDDMPLIDLPLLPLKKGKKRTKEPKEPKGEDENWMPTEEKVPRKEKKVRIHIPGASKKSWKTPNIQFHQRTQRNV